MRMIPSKNKPPPIGFILKSIVEVMKEAFPVNRIARTIVKVLIEGFGGQATLELGYEEVKLLDK